MMQNVNAATRWVALGLITIGTLIGFIGWLGWNRDPGQLVGLLGVVTGALGIGEFANVGKRWTFKKEAVNGTTDPQPGGTV